MFKLVSLLAWTGILPLKMSPDPELLRPDPVIFYSLGGSQGLYLPPSDSQVLRI